VAKPASLRHLLCAEEGRGTRKGEHSHWRRGGGGTAGGGNADADADADTD
jgi:hypothetical protein